MKRFLNVTFALFIFSNVCFSQNEIFYKQIFENKANFKILKIFNGKIPKKFKIIDSTVTIYSKTFWLDGIDLKDPKEIEEIENDEHHPFYNVYIFSQKKLDSLISDEEKIFLSEASQKVQSEKIEIREKNYFTIESSDKIKKGFYFLVSYPVYSSDNKYAFIEVDIKSKYKMFGEDNDNYFGVLKLVFKKDTNDNWMQIYNFDHIIL